MLKSKDLPKVNKLVEKRQQLRNQMESLRNALGEGGQVVVRSQQEETYPFYEVELEGAVYIPGLLEKMMKEYKACGRTLEEAYGVED